MFLQIEHTTEYRYAEPVGLTPHLLRLIPRSSPGLHLIRSELVVSPEHSVRWNLDLEGNILGLVTFPGVVEKLLIKSSLLIEQHLTNPSTSFWIRAPCISPSSTTIGNNRSWPLFSSGVMGNRQPISMSLSDLF